MKDKREKHEFEWPDGESAPDARELQAAREHAQRVEQLLAGEGAGEDDLAALAGMIHHSEHEASLDEARGARLLDEALGARGQGRERRRQLAPLLALAAALLLAIGVALGVGLQGAERAPSRRVSGASRALAPQMLSRSSDGLLGKPIVDRAGASRRLDQVYASRLAGYRALRMHDWRSP